MRLAPATLIFDLDGTLSDPIEGIWRSTNHALQGIGAQPVARQAFAAFIGPPIDGTFRTLVPGSNDAAVAALVAAFRERYGATGYAENVLYPDVPRLLETLGAAGHRRGICTTKRADFAARIVDRFGLAAHFEFIDGGDVGIDKSMQLRGLRERGRIDERAIMIGDRASDIAAATVNGLRAVGVTWGYGSRDELESAAPWGIVETPDALLGLLTR